MRGLRRRVRSDTVRSPWRIALSLIPPPDATSPEDEVARSALVARLRGRGWATEGWKEALRAFAHTGTTDRAVRTVARRALAPLHLDAFRIRAEGPERGWTEAIIVVEVVLFHAAHDAEAIYRTDTVATLLSAFWVFEAARDCHLRVWTLDPATWHMQSLIDEGLSLAITLIRVRAHQRAHAQAESAAGEAMGEGAAPSG